MNRPTTDQKKLIEGIKTNNDLVLKQLYLENYPKVETYILKNNGSKMQAKDTYQEAFMAVWENVRNGKFVPNGDTALNGYLYRIARNKWTDYLRSSEFKKKAVLDETHPKMSTKAETDMSDVDRERESDKRLRKVIATFKTLEEPCRQLLITFYFEKKSMREIAEELNIAEASARNKKYRCIEKLRALVLTPN